MKKTLLLMLLMTLWVSWAAKAQKLVNYTLSTDVTTFNSIVSTGTQLSFSSNDDGYAAIDFPFAFAYGGSYFTTTDKIACSANGFIQLGSTLTSGSTPSYTSSNRVITPLPQFDGHMGCYDDAGAYWKYDATAGTLTIEYHRLGAYYSPYGSYSYQIVFHTNGDIDFIYDEVDHGTATSRTMATFLTDGSNNDLFYVTGPWAEPVKSTTYEARPFTPVPEHGLRYTFSRPIITCPRPTLLDVADEEIEANAATIRWTASNEDQLYFDIYWSTTNTAPEETATPLAANQQGNSFQITGLMAATQYFVWIRGNCGTPQDPDISGGWTVAKSFLTACGGIGPGYTCGFEGPNTGGTTTNPLPACWTRPERTNAEYPKLYNNPFSAHGGSLYFNGSTLTTAQIGVLPEIGQTLDGLRLEFYARIGSATNSPGIISIGYMTDPEDASTFVAVGNPINLTTASYPSSPYHVDFGTYPNDPRYIAIQSNTTTSANVYLDDLTLSLSPSCLDPTMNATATNIGTDVATVSWTAGGTNQLHWDVYYNETGVAPTDETTPQVIYTDQNPFEITGLNASSTYYVWVRGNCGTQADPDYSTWSATYCQFHTVCEDVTIFPWSENFESYNASSSGVKFEDPCWENIHLEGPGTYFFEVYSGTNGTNSTKQLRLHDMSNGTMTKLRLPKMVLQSANYQFVIDVYRSSTYDTKTGEGVRVFASTNGEIEGATELAFIPRLYSVESGIIPAEANGNVWYTYELPIPMSGTCYIILRGESQYGTATYMDNFSVEEIPTCLRPTDLACNSKTAHTATFSWSNGAEGQSAWQIAYSTTADFDPSTVTPVDVTTNPATIDGLAQSTTYYAYVRANCGNGDYSYWSRMYCTFSTITGRAVPTGLVVDQSTITSSQATASWTGVAANEYHESYQIYWATSDVTSVPDEPATPNLISGITATEQVIDGLDSETSYKVWVRDYCGTDGYSNWSSAVTFTTAADCQTPDGLAESEVTTNSAKITWNTYGLTEFNLAYSNDNGESWETVTGVTCPYTFPNNLTANQPYQVKVQATCNTTEWSSVLSFRTECDPITISNSHSWTEDFEAPVTTAAYNTSTVADLVMPYCWDNYTNSTSSYSYAIPHLIKSDAGTNGYNYSSPASQVLYFYGSGYGYAALPEFTNALNELQISFKWATESSSNGTLTLGYITAEDNGTYNTFTAIGEPYTACNESHHQMKSETVYLNNVPATATRLVFCWYYSSWYGANIDDVEVSLLPSCYPVGALSYANVASHTVNLSWGLIDNSQDSWQVQYATNADFTEGVGTADADTNEDFVLGGLTGETHYYVRVRGNCGNDGYGDWSNTVDFTTGIACPAPTMQAVSGITNNSATLSWTGSEASSFNVNYRVVGGPTWFTPENSPVDESTITLTGLETETEYMVRVQAVCGGIDGESLWSNITFTTLSNCADPEELNATNLTDHSATLNWIGAQDSYNVRYRTATPTFFEGFEDADEFANWQAFGVVTTNTGNRFGRLTTAARTDSYGFSFSSFTQTTDYNQYLISPELNNANSIEFYYRSSSSLSTGETFKVGYSTTGNNVEDFTWGEEQSTKEITWSHFEPLALPAGTKYIAIHYYSNYQYQLYIDDMTIVYGEAGAWNTSNTNVTSGLPISGLEYNTMYEWQVQGINDDCDDGLTEWSEATFTTEYPTFTKTIAAVGAENWADGKAGYYLIASPLADAVDPTTITGMTTSDYDLYSFNQAEDDEWRNYRVETFNLVNGQGYLYASKNGVTLHFKGQPYKGNGEIDLTYDGTAQEFPGWNLIGNPFATDATLSKPFYKMAEGGAALSALIEDEPIAAMEGVFVETEADGETVTFTSQSRGNEHASIATANIVIRGNNGQVLDNAIIRFDGGQQLGKFSFRQGSTKVFFPQENKDYAVVAAQSQGEMPVSFKAETNGSYTLSFTTEEVEFSYLHLIDNLTGNDVDLLDNPSYTFDARYTDYANRFKLVFATGADLSNGDFAFVSDGNLIVNGEGTLQVFDVLGHQLFTKDLSTFHSPLSVFHSPGVYVLQLINGNDMKTQKIVIE